MLGIEYTTFHTSNAIEEDMLGIEYTTFHTSNAIPLQ